MKKIIISLILPLITIAYLYADFNDFSDRLEKANENYQNKNYEDAIDEYETLILDGLKNPYIYYNLSNAYYKNNELGKAILNLERALKITPRNKIFQENKNIFSKMIQEPTKNTAEQFLYRVLLIFSLNEIVLITLVFFILLSILLSLYLLKLNRRLIPVIILITIFNFISFSLTSLKFYNDIVLDKYIVIKKAFVRNKPSKEEDVAFEIDEGREVIVLSKVGRWVNIKLSADGLTGWIDKNIIEKI